MMQNGEIDVGAAISAEVLPVSTENEKKKYQELYGRYLETGFDALKRDFGIDMTRKEFIGRCILLRVEGCGRLGRRGENLQICRNMYREYVRNGFESVVRKFAYSHGKGTMVKWFKFLLPEYDGNARRRELEKSRVRYYTKVYEECRRSGFGSAVEKYGCTADRKVLCRQFAKYVEGYEPIKGAYSVVSGESADAWGRKAEESKFWKGFDFGNATLEGMTRYILDRSDFGKGPAEDREVHNIVYLIRNRVNGKIYVGQHRTAVLDDGYMGSGTVLKCAKDKYGIDNFEKMILFDFPTVEEMDAMEKDIVCGGFLEKGDFVYNRCNGGLNGPSADFQREMYRKGMWKAANEGKLMYHDTYGNRRYFAEGEVPEGWVKGDILDEELHRKIDERMDTLRSLGSKFTWREGVSVEQLDNMIEQFRKAKAEEDGRKALWREIFGFYKENGRAETLSRYSEVDGIWTIDRNFKKYLPEEFEEFRKKRMESRTRDSEEFDMIKRELQSYGIERAWGEYGLKALRRMRGVYMRNRRMIDEKIAYYGPIMDECFEHGIRAVALKHKDGNLHHKLAKYLPVRYRAYMMEKHGKPVEVNEDVYATAACAQSENRKKRTPSEKTIQRMKDTQLERERLYKELWVLGSTSKYSDQTALTTLRAKIAGIKRGIEKNAKEKELYKAFYLEIMENGYKTACEKFNYTGTLGNLKKKIKKHVEEYKITDFDTKYPGRENPGKENAQANS